jgi:hypothetical protein
MQFVAEHTKATKTLQTLTKKCDSPRIRNLAKNQQQHRAGIAADPDVTANYNARLTESSVTIAERTISLQQFVKAQRSQSEVYTSNKSRQLAMTNQC